MNKDSFGPTRSLHVIRDQEWSTAGRRVPENHRFGLTECDSRGKVRFTHVWQVRAVSTASSLARWEGKSRFATGTGSRSRVCVCACACVCVYVYVCRNERRDLRHRVPRGSNIGSVRRVVTIGEQGRQNNRKPAGRIDMCTRAALDRILTCSCSLCHSLFLRLSFSSVLKPPLG